MSKTVLVTGSAGFIGSHFVDHILKNTDWKIIGFDSFRHRGDSSRVQNDPRYQVFTMDLSAPVSHLVKNKIGEIDYVVNFASESHVDRSIEQPRPFIENNVGIALTMGEFCRQIKPKKFVQISTDEVYGAAPEGTLHKEWSPILPSNPYSASKAAQEAILISYWRTYSIPLIIVNSMNLIGQRQDVEKFVPSTIRKIAKGEIVKIHGSKEYIGKRFYQHARNLSDAVLFLLREHNPAHYVDKDETVYPSRFNVVGEVELDNLEMAQNIATLLGDVNFLKYELEDFHKTRPGHDRRYALDGTKIKEFGWKQPKGFFQSLKDTIDWYKRNSEWLK